MDGKLNTAKQRVFGHWELSSEPLSSCWRVAPPRATLTFSPSTPQHQLPHNSNAPTCLRNSFGAKREGKKGKENQKRAWFQALAAERKDAHNTGYEKS